jgi:CheY-like chemotaxis protein
MPSVLIVDDEDDIRFLVRELIDAAGDGYVITGEASSGEEAIERWRELHPQVIVLDHRMPGLSGLDAAERILAEQPDLPILLFTAFRDDGVVRRAAELGIRVCVSKADLSRLTAELRALASEFQRQEPV